MPERQTRWRVNRPCRSGTVTAPDEKVSTPFHTPASAKDVRTPPTDAIRSGGTHARMTPGPKDSSARRAAGVVVETSAGPFGCTSSAMAAAQSPSPKAANQYSKTGSLPATLTTSATPSVSAHAALHASLTDLLGSGHSCVHIAGLGDFRLLLVVGW